MGYVGEECGVYMSRVKIKGGVGEYRGGLGSIIFYYLHIRIAKSVQQIFSMLF